MSNRIAEFFRRIVIGYGIILGAILAYSVAKATTIVPSLMNLASGIVFIYIFPAGFLLLIVVALIKNHKNFIANIGLLLISLTFTLYGVEFFILQTSKNRKIKKIEIIQSYQAKAQEIYPAIFPYAIIDEQTSAIKTKIADKEVLPLASIANVTTIYCKEAGEFLIYHSDEHGFHNPPNLWQQPSLDIVALGDSFTQGACVPSELNMIAHIRNQYPKTLNLGGAGGGPLADLAALKEFGQKFKPKVVLWDYVQNDLGRDLNREKKVNLLMNYLKNPKFTQNLIQQQPAIDEILKKFARAEIQKSLSDENPNDTDRYDPTLKGKLRRFALFFRIPRIRSLILPKLTKTYPDDFEFSDQELDYQLFQQILAEAQRTIASWGGHLVFVFVPSFKNYGGERLSATAQNPQQFKQKLFNLVTALNIPIVDIDKEIRATSSNRLEYYARLSTHLMTTYGHFNEKGYALAGHAVVEYLKQSHWLNN